MIGSVRGRLAAKLPPLIVLECGGVGYEIETPMSTFLELPEAGADVFLHTHLVVREDAHTLFGFATAEEKTLFRSLLKVSGVGAKMGLAILSAMSVADFQRCVQHEDKAMLTKIPGVGGKTADRLILELRDRLGKATLAPKAAAGRAAPPDPRSEAFDALVALGYKPNEVKRLLEQLDLANKSAEDIIRSALKQAIA
ncbi:MAG TPA: Holliday junction branch migration protein RuvA [Woeseiaceae bacterium]|nr:Holliday junction branch migration protein RuvA [Woeseiaceae bacterium]